jgi:hypothetical protein
MSLPVDKRVKDFIKQQVADGVFNMAEIRRHTEIFIKRSLFDNMPLPSRFNRRYYPLRRDYNNIVYRARLELMHSRIDQQNLVQKSAEWEAASPNDSFFFRPYVPNTSQNSPSGESEDVTVSGDAGRGLLLIYQTLWQKQLLAKYGFLCLLDATYRTTRYALPLFFLCVRTNVDYIVVGTFITQFEDAASIGEALLMIRSWNADWSPTSFMVDCCDAELKALDTVFAGQFLHNKHHGVNYYFINVFNFINYKIYMYIVKYLHDIYSHT